MLDEERVAFGRGLDADHLNRGERAAGEAHQHLLDLGVREPSERDALRAPAAQQPSHHAGERALRVEVGLPVGAEHDDLAVAKALGEVAHQEDSRLISPLQVVQHDEHGLGALRCDEYVEDSFEQEFGPAIGTGVGAQGRSAHLGAKAGHELGEHGAARGRELLKRSLRGNGDRTRQDVAEGRVWCFLLLGAPAAEDDPSLASSVCRDFRGQAGCADAGRAGEEDHSTGAGGGAVEDEADVELLLVAPHETIPMGDGRGDDGRHLARGRLVEAPSVGEALQLVVPAIGEVDLGHRPDQLAHDLGDEDLPALGLACDARGHVDCRAEDVARLLDDLTGIDADADPELAVWVCLAVVGDRTLDVKSALDCVPGGAEAHHHAVAQTLDATARVLVDRLADDGLVCLHDLVGLGEAAGRQQVGRALDVREHDGDRSFRLARGEAADDGVRGQRGRRVDWLAEPGRDLAQQ